MCCSDYPLSSPIAFCSLLLCWILCTPLYFLIQIIQLIRFLFVFYFSKYNFHHQCYFYNIKRGRRQRVNATPANVNSVAQKNILTKCFDNQQQFRTAFQETNVNVNGQVHISWAIFDRRTASFVDFSINVNLKAEQFVCHIRSPCLPRSPSCLKSGTLYGFGKFMQICD